VDTRIYVREAKRFKTTKLQQKFYPEQQGVCKEVWKVWYGYILSVYVRARVTSQTGNATSIRMSNSDHIFKRSSTTTSGY